MVAAPWRRLTRDSPVERPCPPGGDRRGERERQPLPVRELQRRDHRHQQDRHGQHDRQHEALPQGGELGRLGVGTGWPSDLRGRRGRDPGAIAHGLDGRHQVVRRHHRGIEVTAAFSVAKLTLAETPSSRLSFFSIRLAQGPRHAGEGEVDVSLCGRRWSRLVAASRRRVSGLHWRGRRIRGGGPSSGSAAPRAAPAPNDATRTKREARSAWSPASWFVLAVRHTDASVSISSSPAVRWLGWPRSRGGRPRPRRRGRRRR